MSRIARQVSKMACKENAVCMVDAHHLASVIRSRNEKIRKLTACAPVTSSNPRDMFWQQVLIIDSRSFLEYNDYHIVGAINVCCSKLVKRRLQQDKVIRNQISICAWHSNPRYQLFILEPAAGYQSPAVD